MTKPLRSQSWFQGHEYYNFARRAWLRSEGFSHDIFEGKPVVGICNSWSELNNCNAHLRQVAEAVKRGVWAAGGFPVEFPTISLGEMFMRPTSMLYRNLMAMDVEESIRANPIDGVVLLCGCDKTTPAQLMGAASADLPAIVVSGGPMLSGQWRDRKLGAGTDGRKLFDLYRTGRLTEEEWSEIEGCIARSAGHCTVMGTASTMTSLAEAMGMTLPGCAAIPAPDSRRLAIAEASGRRMVDMIREDLIPSRIMTRDALENAITVHMALGGSTNAVVHLLAVAGRLGIDLTLDDFDRISRYTPYLVNVKPSGEYLMEDFFAAGGVPTVMAELLPLLHGDCLTANGRTVVENVSKSECFNRNVVRAFDQPLAPEGGTAILYGNLAPSGAVLKPTAASPHLLQHRGRAVVFENHEQMRQQIDSDDLPVDAHSVLVMKNGGPKGAPGFPEWGQIPMPAKLLKQGVEDVVRVSDARMSGTSFGTVILHVAPESAVGGPLAIVESGDEIILDTAARRIDLAVPQEQINRRLAQFEPPPAHYERGYGKMFLEHIEQANLGCDFDFLKNVSPRYFFLALAVFLFLANRGAYKGYFQNDDLDNLAFTRELPPADFLAPFVSLRVYDNNFRPTGHLFYRLMGHIAGLHYTPYIAFLHLVHFLNCILLWLILKRLDLPDLAAAAGVLFFAFNMAVFDVFWMPMYVFDLLCGLFCLLSLLAYLNGRWILALLAMFVAYRAKEIAIMLPVVLFLWDRRSRQVIPFFALSLILGVQAIIQNHARPETDYTLHLDPASVWKCIQFYSGRVFFIPYAGLLLLILPLFFRDRRFLYGLTGFCALLLPMLLLPGRLFSAYLYVPLFSLAIAVAVLAARQSPAVLAIFFLLWLPWNYLNLRRQRNVVLADARDRRAFTQQLTAFNEAHPRILSYVYAGAPVNAYGSHAIVKLAHPVGAPIRFAGLEDRTLPDILDGNSLAIVSWDKTKLRTVVRTSQTPDASYLKMSDDTPIWQLGQGWYPLEGSFRWTQPEASARLLRPTNAAHFELVVNIGLQYITKVQRSHITVAINGGTIGEHEFTQPGWQTVRWNLNPAPAGTAEIVIRVTPEFYANRKLGIAVGAFGFDTQ